MAITSDQLVLAALANRDRYHMLIDSVPEGMLSPDLEWLLRWFKPYWKAYPGHEQIDPDSLYTLITLRHSLPEARDAIVKHVIDMLREPLTDEEVAGAVQQLTDRDLAGKASKLIMDYQSGAEIDLAYELQKASTAAFEASTIHSSNKFLTGNDIDAVMEELSDEGGLRPTFLGALNQFMRPMLPGDTILYAAAPGAGKTSLIAYSVTSLAPQIASLYGDRPVLWLNNEGSGTRILGRLVSSALNATYDEILELKAAGTLNAQYNKAMHGSSRVLIRDAHGYTMANVERLVQSVRPCMVVFDMMAHFSIGTRSIESYEKVERLWQSARELAVKYDFIALGTSQFSVDGINSTYPKISDLKDSKVGVQGAIETMLFMGKALDDAMDKVRYFSCPKIKRARTGAGDLKFQAYFDTDRCQFRDGA